MNTIIAKTDLLKEDPNYYKVGKTPEIRDLDTYYYVTILGKGDPAEALFHQSIEALYKVIYTLKFQMKDRGQDFVVPKMEGFWWIDGGLEKQHEFMDTPMKDWNWKLLIRLPDFVEEEDFSTAVEVASQKNPDISLISEINHEKINEGRCVQILHIGPYDQEAATLQSLFELVTKEGLKVNNYHREIYLTDPRRTPEERLKTILRYGVA